MLIFISCLVCRFFKQVKELAYSSGVFTGITTEMIQRGADNIALLGNQTTTAMFRQTL